MSALLSVEVDPTRRAVIYCRISSDRDRADDGAGAGLGVKRQEKENRVFADALGLEVGTVRDRDLFVDNNKSAKEGSVRPAWDAMLDAVDAGEVSVVIAWHFDRLTRNDVDFARLMRVCKANDVRVMLKTSGPLDVTTPSGRLMARQQAAVAIYENEHRGERMTAKHEELALAGKPSGGPRRYGYNHDMTVRADERVIVREVARRVLAGEALASICADLTRRGVPTVKGGKWTNTTWVRLLTSEHVVGARTHHGAVTVQDAWPALLDEEDWHALRRLLLDPARASFKGNARTHLLSGIVRCATCGGTVRHAWAGAGKDGQRGRRYRCHDLHITRDADVIDMVVTEHVVALLERLDESGLIADATDDDADSIAVLRAELQQVDDDLDGLADRLAAGAITDRMAKRVTAKLEARYDELSAAVDAAVAAAGDRRQRPQRVLAGVVGSNARATWEGLTLERKRAIIEALVVVTMNPAPHQGAHPDPAQIVTIERALV